MMRPNLSLEHIAATLAALGTSAVIAACARAGEPAGVHSDEPTKANASAAALPPPPPVVADPTPAPDNDRRAPADDLKKKDRGAPSGNAVISPSKPKPTGTTGQASCGAGTCTADTKKK